MKLNLPEGSVHFVILPHTQDNPGNRHVVGVLSCAVIRLCINLTKGWAFELIRSLACTLDCSFWWRWSALRVFLPRRGDGLAPTEWRATPVTDPAKISTAKRNFLKRDYGGVVWYFGMSPPVHRLIHHHSNLSNDLRPIRRIQLLNFEWSFLPLLRVPFVW